MYYVDNSGITILKKECGLVSRWSFSVHDWVFETNLEGINENNAPLTRITKEEAYATISKIEEVISMAQSNKFKK